MRNATLLAADLIKSEINFQLNHFFDEGIWAQLGDNINGWKNEAGSFETLDDAFEYLISQAESVYPNYRCQVAKMQSKDAPCTTIKLEYKIIELRADLIKYADMIEIIRASYESPFSHSGYGIEVEELELMQKRYRTNPALGELVKQGQEDGDYEPDHYYTNDVIIKDTDPDKEER